MINLADIPNLDFLRECVFKAVAAKSPTATMCGIRTWLTVQQLRLNPEVIQGLLGQLVDSGTVAKNTASFASNCTSADAWTLTDIGRELLG